MMPHPSAKTLPKLKLIPTPRTEQFSRCFVRFYGWYHGRDVLCVGLEYLPLGDLRGYLSTKGGRVPQTEAQQIVSQLLDGLRFMHEEGFTHRDLKPAVSAPVRSVATRPLLILAIERVDKR